MSAVEFADEAFLGGVDLARRLNRRAAEMCARNGLPPLQIAIASIYSSFDIAERMFLTAEVEPTADARQAAGIGTIQWLRTALDEMERQLLSGGITHG
jgi:hypothetical protein